MSFLEAEIVKPCEERSFGAVAFLFLWAAHRIVLPRDSTIWANTQR